jgi:hypothetical protein
MEKKTTSINTMIIEPISSSNFGQTIFVSSKRTSFKNWVIFIATPIGFNFLWQARRDSNPQPSDLESAALPLELLAYSSYFVSLCMQCLRQREQNLLIFKEPAVLCLDTTCV